MSDIDFRLLRHAVTNRKNCHCSGADLRDPKCENDWPDICPWRGYQLYRFTTGDFSSPEWWEYQLGLRDDYSDQPPDPRQFDPGKAQVVGSDRKN